MASQNICKFNFSRASDLICTNFIYEALGNLSAPRKADYHIMGLVTGGEGVLRFGKDFHRLRTGALFFIPRLEYFCVEGEALAYFYISYHGRRGDEYMERLGIHRNNCVFDGYEDLIPFWRNCQALAEDGNIDLLCESVLLYSLANLRPIKAMRNDILARIITMTQERFTESGFSLAVIAEEVGYDPKYLSALFKKKKSIPFTRYLRDIRLRHAVFLMEEGLVSVKNIALLSGFQDPLYFSKIFTAAEGISPKAYIAAIQQRTSERQTDAP